MAETCSW